MPHEYEGIPLSLGAGVNSVALAVLLVGEGWRGPIVMAATGCEWPETDAYVDTFGRWLAERGLEVTVLGGEWRRGKEQMSLIDYCEYYRVTPRIQARFCTSTWKIEPMQRWCEANGYEFADMLVGVSAEESRRMTDRIRPLVDRHIDRDACARIIQTQAPDIGVPSKSSCWFCPFQSATQWRYLLDVHPDLFARASQLEAACSERRGKVTTINPDGKYTLRQFAQQGTLFSGLPYYIPCMCRL